MLDSDRKTEFRNRKKELGLVAINVFLDSTTIGYLDELVELSDNPSSRPSGNSAVLSEAIARMYREHKKIAPWKPKDNWLDQNKRIARNIITHLFKTIKSEKKIINILNENRYPSPKWFGDDDTKWSRELIAKLSRIKTKKSEK